VVESRAEAELSLNTTVQFADVLDGDHLYDTTKRPWSRRCWATRASSKSAMSVDVLAQARA
jgi:hypothetical protein